MSSQCLALAKWRRCFETGKRLRVGLVFSCPGVVGLAPGAVGAVAGSGSRNLLLCSIRDGLWASRCNQTAHETLGLHLLLCDLLCVSIICFAGGVHSACVAPAEASRRALVESACRAAAGHAPGASAYDATANASCRPVISQLPTPRAVLITLFGTRRAQRWGGSTPFFFLTVRQRDGRRAPRARSRQSPGMCHPASLCSASSPVL